MGEWAETSLQALLKFGNGKSRPKNDGMIPVYGGNGILGYSDQTNYDGDIIVIGRVGAYCGATYFESRPIWVSDNALSARAKDENDPKFLYYHLKNLGLNQFAEGSSHPLVTHTLLNAIDTSVPKDPREQKAIAEVLSSLDNKIDLLHRQNKTLESLVETLFRNWFIDGAQDDWEPTTVGEIVTIKGGTTPSTKSPEFWDGDICWTSPRDLSNQSSVYLFDTTRKITTAGLAQIGSGLMPVGTVLMSSRAPIGYLTIADIPVAINQGYIAMVCDKSVSSHFVYLWCKANMESIKNAGNGSTFEEISKSNFKALECLLPPPSLLSDFEIQAEALFQKIHDNSKQVLELEKIRNTLLPKLMSGDVRVEYEAAS